MLDLQDLFCCSLRGSVVDGLGWGCGLGWFFSFGWLLSLWGIGLLLGDVLFLLRLVFVTFLAGLFSMLAFLLLISVLVVLCGSWLEVVLVTIALVLVLALVLVALWSWGISIVLHLLLVHLLDLHLRSLSNEHLSWWLAVELKTLDLSLHGNWSWAEVLVWVESTESGHLGKAGDLDERWWLCVQWAELEWAD